VPRVESPFTLKENKKQFQAISSHQVQNDLLQLTDTNTLETLLIEDYTLTKPSS
jgi:hypothetical protein